MTISPLTKGRIVRAIACIIMLIATAYGTYRYTMEHMDITTDGHTAYATVYGQTDTYSIKK